MDRVDLSKHRETLKKSSSGNYFSIDAMDSQLLRNLVFMRHEKLRAIMTSL